MNGLVRATALLTAFALAACGGGGGGGGVTVPPPGPTPTPAPGAVVPASLAIVIPKIVGPSSKTRDPRYVSPATAVVSIVVNGGTPQNFPVANGTPCAPGTSTISGTCSVYTINVPAGNDTFTVTLLDASNHVLSQGTVQQTIVADTANSVNITFNGVAAGLRVALANPSPPSGSVARIPVSLLPVDAAGFTLVGAPGTLPNITVTDPDNSGTTGLYLAGSDGTCSTQAAAPASSVTTTQSGAQYVLVCLYYSGAASGTVTITAAISGGPSGTAAFVPSQAGPSGISGVWMVGSPPGGPETLERVDSALAVSVAISGSQTVFGSVQPAAIAVDPAGDVSVLIQTGPPFKIVKYSGTNGGNTAPVSTTSFSLPGIQNLDTWALAADGTSSMYVLGSNGQTPPPGTPIPQSCTIYRVALSGGTVTPAAIGDCTNLVAGANGTELRLRTDPQGRVYFTVLHPGSNTTAVHTIFRYVRNPDGTLTADSGITVSHGIGDFDLDPNDNVLVADTFTVYTYAAAGFVTGQDPAVNPIDTYNVQNQIVASGVLGLDRAGNIYLAGDAPNTFNGQVSVIAAPGHSVTKSTPFSAFAFAAATTAAPSGGGAIGAQPSTLELTGPMDVTVTEPGYQGPITEADNCGSLATVSPGSRTGPSGTFTVTPKPGVAGGTCTVTFSDSGNIHTANVHVGLTSTTIGGQAARRRP
jgi:hypothetical protein